MKRLLALRPLILTLLVFTCVNIRSTQADSQMNQIDAVDLLADAQAESETPSILSEQDIILYRRILNYQNKGSYALADKSIKKLSNDILMGYVLHHRYMGDHYHSKFSELQEWMRKYSDHAGADQIYKLGLKKGKNIANVRSKIRGPKVGKKIKTSKESAGHEEYMIQYSYGHLSSKNRRYVKRKIAQFKRALSKGWTKSARNIVQDGKFKRYVKGGDLYRMKGYLAYSYFLDGHYDRASSFAKSAADYGAEKATYVMGLLAFKSSNYIAAADYFNQLASTTRSHELSALASVFMAKSYEILDEDSAADDAWENAAKYPKTFYGMVAAVKTDEMPDYDWEEADMSLEDAREVLSYKGGMRAIALLQIDQKKQASRELINLLKSHQSDEVTEAILAFAQQEGLPNVSLKIAKLGLLKETDFHYSALYPMPNWTPVRGWDIDKALVYAIVRQESQFKTNARSSAGAAGVMQVMPATASFIERDRSLYRRNRSKLYNPLFNLSVGQNYISHLFKDARVQDDLIRMLAAYNAGPGNLRKFERKMGHVSDPLIYIESIAARETRHYVKNVLMNFWMYRHQMDQDLTSLDDITNNRFPQYAARDTDAMKYAKSN